METKSIFICPEDCQYFRGEDGCASGQIDTSFIYEKEGDYPICPFYSKPLEDMTLERALKILNYFIETGWMQPEPSFSNATKLGIGALVRIKKERELQAGLYNIDLPGEATRK